MPTTPGPRATNVTLIDLDLTERDTVLAILHSLDRAGLAAASGRTVADLQAMPQLSGIRGVFRTPWPLLAAVVGFGFDRPARSRGVILDRLGLKPGDNSAFQRLKEASEFFGIALPATCKDGARVGESILDDEVAVRKAYAGSSSFPQLRDRLGLSSNGQTNRRIRERLELLGLGRLPGRRPQCRPATELVVRAPAKACRSDTTLDGQPAPDHHYQPWTGKDLDRMVRMYRQGSSAEEIAREVKRTPSAVFAQLTLSGVPQTPQACAFCEAPLPVKAGPGRKPKYCGNSCRNGWHLQQQAAKNAAVKARTQQPCEHCGKAIASGARAKRFCDKACSKAAGYRASRSSGSVCGVAAGAGA